jgi:hypothetical protein
MAFEVYQNYSSGTVCKLSPTGMDSAAGTCLLTQGERRWVRLAIELKERSKMLDANNPRGVLFIATNAQGLTRVFTGMACPEGSTGLTIAAEKAAVYAAGAGGYISDGLLVVTVRDAHMVNPIDRGCLMELRRFGGHAEFLLVGDDGRVSRTSLHWHSQ